MSGGTNRLECLADVSMTGNGRPDSVTCEADGGGRRAPVEADRRGGMCERARMSGTWGTSVALTERILGSGDSDVRARFGCGADVHGPPWSSRMSSESVIEAAPSDASPLLNAAGSGGTTRWAAAGVASSNAAELGCGGRGAEGRDWGVGVAFCPAAEGVQIEAFANELSGTRSAAGAWAWVVSGHINAEGGVPVDHSARAGSSCLHMYGTNGNVAGTCAPGGCGGGGCGCMLLATAGSWTHRSEWMKASNSEDPGSAAPGCC